MQTSRERCEKQLSQDFAREVKAAVGAYFEHNRLSRHANPAMVVKTVVLLAIYFGAYGLIVSGVLPLPWMWLACFVDGGRDGRDRLLGHPRRAARRLFGEPARQPADRLLLRHARRQLLHVEDHPQRHPPHLDQHPRLRRGPRGLAADPAEPAHAVQAHSPLPAPLRLRRLQHGHAVLGVRQGLQVLPPARSRALPQQAASALRVAVPDRQQASLLLCDDRGAAAWCSTSPGGSS